MNESNRVNPNKQPCGRAGGFLRRYTVAACHVYLSLLLLWIVLYTLTGDRYPILGLCNYFAPYLYLPLPIALLTAALTNRRELWLGCIAGCVSFALLWGRQFTPLSLRVQEREPTLTVMSFNLLGTRTETDSALALIDEFEAEVLFLQELNHLIAHTIDAELSARYPYRVLDPRDDFGGMGVFSRFPLEETGERLPLKWVGTPQVLRLTWEGEQVTLINFHMWATGLAPRDVLRINFRAREAQALFLADFARGASRNGPVIVAGDGNFTPLSDAHRLLSMGLQDSWEEAGVGFGHTFPAGKIDGRLPRMSGVPVPPLFCRIDYIFHSNDLTALSASVAPYDGVSDHRAVVVNLTLSP